MSRSPYTTGLQLCCFLSWVLHDRLILSELVTNFAYKLNMIFVSCLQYPVTEQT